MFVRLAACGFAAVFAVAPAPPRDQSGAPAGIDAAATMAAPLAGRATPDAVAPGDTEAQSKLAALVAATPSVPSPIATEPFGLETLPWFSGDIVEKWHGVAAEIHAERDVLARCREASADCPPAAQKFLAIIAAGRAETGRARIGAINRAINGAIKPTSDLAQWGVIERWSPPLETISTGRGDCEDYAIAKFVALIEAGVAPEDVKLVVVHDEAANDGHAVAAARVDGRWIVLDNRWLALLADRELPRMTPRFVIDDAGVRAYVRTPAQNAVPAIASLGLPSAD